MNLSDKNLISIEYYETNEKIPKRLRQFVGTFFIAFQVKTFYQQGYTTENI